MNYLDPTDAYSWAELRAMPSAVPQVSLEQRRVEPLASKTRVHWFNRRTMVEGGCLSGIVQKAPPLGSRAMRCGVENLVLLT